VERESEKACAGAAQARSSHHREAAMGRRGGYCPRRWKAGVSQSESSGGTKLERSRGEETGAAALGAPAW
jgi:hypothetical protein